MIYLDKLHVKVSTANTERCAVWSTTHHPARANGNHFDYANLVGYFVANFWQFWGSSSWRVCFHRVAPLLRFSIGRTVVVSRLTNSAYIITLSCVFFSLAAQYPVSLLCATGARRHGCRSVRYLRETPSYRLRATAAHLLPIVQRVRPTYRAQAERPFPHPRRR